MAIRTLDRTGIDMTALLALKTRNEEHPIEFPVDGGSNLPPTDDANNDSGGRREGPRFNKYALLPAGAAIFTALVLVAHEVLSMPVAK